MEASYDAAQETVDVICKIYTNLTSILLEYGYEYILDNLDKAEDVKYIDETLKLLNMLEADMDQEEPRHEQPQEKASTKPSSYPKAWNFMTRLATSNADMINKRVPLIKYQEVPETVRQHHARIAAKFNAQLAREFPEISKKQQLQVTDLRNRLLNKQLMQALQTSLKKKIEENLEQVPADQPRDQQLNRSINVENFDLEI